MRNRGWRSSRSRNSARSSSACVTVALLAVVRSTLIEGTTTTDSSARFFWMESHAGRIASCRSSNAR